MHVKVNERLTEVYPRVLKEMHNPAAFAIF